jgi:hypothetical protein
MPPPVHTVWPYGEFGDPRRRLDGVADCQRLARAGRDRSLVMHGYLKVSRVDHHLLHSLSFSAIGGPPP